MAVEGSQFCSPYPPIVTGPNGFFVMSAPRVWPQIPNKSQLPVASHKAVAEVSKDRERLVQSVVQLQLQLQLQL